jgi:TorA maturation chaperone TorD
MKRGSVPFVPALFILAGALAAPGTTHAGIATTLAAAPSSSTDRAIYRAFRDVLDRDPTDRELRRYRERVQADDWSEQDIRDSLRRRSDVRRPATTRDEARTAEEADRITRDAYRDVLDREPDAATLRRYRRLILDDNWSEDKVRASLREGSDYRAQTEMTRQSAEEIVRRAYLSTLGREPDPASRGYVDGVLYDGWTQADVERDIRKSPEYRNKH